jgi:Fe-Mn family superoxide dismutase
MKTKNPVTQRLWNTSFISLLASSFLMISACSSKPPEQVFVQAPLPYAENALEPVISAQTLSFHYGKHHAAYVKQAAILLEQSGLDAETPEKVIEMTAGKEKYQDLFNQAAQAYNHDFFWNCLKPHGGGDPTGDLLQMIEKSFGSYGSFKEAFVAKAKGVFGSGWVFLVQDGDKLAIIATANADTAIAHGLKPLFTVDVWEHSYYLDYQNERAQYVEAVLDHLANWDFVASGIE